MLAGALFEGYNGGCDRLWNGLSENGDQPWRMRNPLTSGT